MIQKRENKIFVQLSSGIDEVQFFQLSTNEKYENLIELQDKVFFVVNSIKQAKQFCQKFIDNYNLGSSNWTGGLVVVDSFNFVERVSYNGRVWDNEDWRISKEIELC